MLQIGQVGAGPYPGAHLEGRFAPCRLRDINANPAGRLGAEACLAVLDFTPHMNRTAAPICAAVHF